jgi:hypothetical protein
MTPRYDLSGGRDETPDRSTKRNRNDAALDEQNDEADAQLAQDAESALIGLQQVQDSGLLDYENGRRVDDAVEVLARLCGQDVQTSEGRRLKEWCSEVLEGRRPGQYHNREKKLKKWCEDLKRRR